jgi:hypothetical protein
VFFVIYVLSLKFTLKDTYCLTKLWIRLEVYELEVHKQAKNCICLWMPIFAKQRICSEYGEFFQVFLVYLYFLYILFNNFIPRPSDSVLKRRDYIFFKGDFYSFKVLNSTLIHLPPHRFHSVGGCWDWTQDCCDWGIGQTDALASRLNLIHRERTEKTLSFGSYMVVSF